MHSQIRTGRSLMKRRKGLPRAGFTLIELMIVITIILILIGMAVGRYDKSVQKANEAVLKNNLQTIRTSIDNYTLDKQDRKSTRLNSSHTVISPLSLHDALPISGR